MIKLDDIISKVKAYNSNANIDLIKKAYVYSAKAHEGQMRKSGQPYVIHPLEVGNILAEMKLDVSSIVAGILHDTIEDTDVTKDDLNRLFGSDIADLVDGVTKLSKLNFNSQQDRQAENFRKMILAMSKDIRVILIKLADRLNNMSTLQYMSEEKQMKIAQETLDIYAPLASRLGIDWMKIQLEDLSFRFLKTEAYKQVQRKLARLKKNREQYIQKVEETIQKYFQNSLKDFKIAGRMKHAFGIYKKMQRQNISFEQVNDLIAFRILVHSLEECYEALGLLHSLWKPVPGRFKDYIAMPKTNNYQSLHTTVICLDGERVEFQIKTFEMHEVADKGIAAHWKYKEDGHLDLESQRTFQWLRQLMEWQKELKDSLEFMDTVKMDLFSNDIYVFTPKGELRALPYGATPLDFAFSIHTHIGMHCQGAKVGGKIVPLNYQLQSGDEVEIITSSNRIPTKDWLKMAATSRAKAKIRQYLKQEQREKNMLLGKKIFEDECRKYAIDPSKFLESPEFLDAMKKKGVVGDQSFYLALAYGKVSAPLLFSQLNPEKKEELSRNEGIIQKIFRKVSFKNKDQVKVSGLDDVLVIFAKCCSPIPGDQIIGYISRGRGVLVHRVECSHVPNLENERRIDVSWGDNAASVRTAKLKIFCDNKTGMLALIANVISERKVNITKALVRSSRDDHAVIALDVEVKNVHELHSIIRAVEKIDGIIQVTRDM